MIRRNSSKQNGFTIIEMMVSIGLFVMVLTVSMSALLAVVDGYRKAQTLGVASDSSKLILEDMTRSIVQGNSFHCDKDDTTPIVTEPNSCSSGANSLVLQSNEGGQIEYWLLNNEVWKKNVDGSSGRLSNTDVVVITDLTFIVEAGESGDDQPRVMVKLSGDVGQGDELSHFDVQTTVTQRAPK